MTNEISVTGMILSLEEKQTGTGECFYMLDLQPFYGPAIRTQVWNKGYEFIKSNLLRADKNGINGDVIELKATGNLRVVNVEKFLKHINPRVYSTLLHVGLLRRRPFLFLFSNIIYRSV